MLAQWAGGRDCFCHIGISQIRAIEACPCEVSRCVVGRSKVGRTEVKATEIESA